MTNNQSNLSAVSSYPEVFLLESYAPKETDKEPIKSSIGVANYTIYTPLMESIEIYVLLLHCMKFMEKVCKVVSNPQVHGCSMFMIYTHTLSTSLMAVWNQVMVDFGSHLPPLMSILSPTLRVSFATSLLPMQLMMIGLTCLT